MYLFTVYSHYCLVDVAFPEIQDKLLPMGDCKSNISLKTYFLWQPCNGSLLAGEQTDKLGAFLRASAPSRKSSAAPVFVYTSPCFVDPVSENLNVDLLNARCIHRSMI